MTIQEYLHAIKKINPSAHCVVWEGNVVKWDENHKGAKPTYEECLALESTVKAELLALRKPTIEDRLKLLEATRPIIK